MIPAVLYVRRSSEKDDDRVTLVTQLEACREYAKAHGMAVADEVQDEYTGTVHLRERRRGVDAWRMLTDGRAKAVVVYAFDRLSRADLVDALVLMRDILSLGAQIHVVGVGAVYDLMDVGTVIRLWQGGDERRKIVERMARGKRGRFESGSIVWDFAIAYGYRRHRSERTHKTDGLTIVKREAQIVRAIFGWRTGKAGPRMSLNQIANTLNDKGVLSPNGDGAWYATTVRNVLTNPLYDGRVIRGEYEFEAENLRLVPHEMWLDAQRLVRESYRARPVRRHEHLLSGYIRCGVCGRLLMCDMARNGQGRDYFYYRCGVSKQPKIKRHDHMAKFNATYGDDLVWEYVRKVLDEWDVLTATIEARTTRQGQGAEQERAKLADLDRQIHTTEAKLSRMVSALADASDRVLAAREKSIKDLDTKLTGLQQRREQLADRVEGDARTRQRRAQAISQIDEFRRAADGATFDQRRGVLEILGVKVVCFVGKSGQRYLRISSLISEETDIFFDPPRKQNTV